jgi:hypothetical protein
MEIEEKCTRGVRDFRDVESGLHSANQVLRMPEHQFTYSLVQGNETHINNPRLDCTKQQIIGFVSFANSRIVVDHPLQLNPRKVR